MKRSTNSVEVKRQNRNRVFRYVNGQAETSMPEISAALDISGPTVLTIVNELKEEGVLKEAGELKSTGGRKAKAIAAVKDIKYAVGIDLTANHISITYTDLSEKALKHVRIRKSFEYTNEYLDALAVFTRRFIEENAIPEDKILGIGISMPCIIDKKEQLITYSNALDIYNVSCSEWKEHFKYPAVLLNDANCAAIAESAEHVNCGNMVYLMLSNTVGGAVLFENSNVIMTAGNELEAVDMYRGDNWRSAEFGHMVIHPGGRTCYCGKKGCLDAYGFEAGEAGKAYEELMAKTGQVEIQLLGLGCNGHIGFNEPADEFTKVTGEIDLTDSTIEANKRFFEKKEDVPRKAVSMGIGTIMRAKKIVLLVNGENKAEILKEVVNGPVTPKVPGSILQFHPHVTVICDEEAAKYL